MKERIKKDIVIIGAGMAGLTAALLAEKYIAKQREEL